MGILTTLDEDRVAIFDPKLRLVDASDAWAQFGSSSGFCSCPDGNSEELNRLFQLPSHLSELEHLKIAVNRLSAGTQKHFRFNYLSEMNGPLRIFEFSLLSEGQKGRLRIEARHRDVTTTVDGAVVLPLVSDFLDNVREDERRRMAAELHDSTVQHLTAVNLNIINLRRALAQGKNTEKLIEVIEKSGEAAQDEIRLFSYLMFPCQLEAGGFRSTIEHYLVGFARRSHLNITFHIPSRIDTAPAALQHALLRITQEALSNVHRHASAHRVAVTLVMDDQVLTLKIADDGHGILPTNTDNKNRSRCGDAEHDRSFAGV